MINDAQLGFQLEKKTGKRQAEEKEELTSNFFPIPESVPKINKG